MQRRSTMRSLVLLLLTKLCVCTYMCVYTYMYKHTLKFGLLHGTAELQCIAYCIRVAKNYGRV